MKVRFMLLFGSILSLAGCFSSNGPITTRAGNLTQEQVDQIVKDCGGLLGMASIKKDDLIIHHAGDVTVTACVLRALQATGETTLTAVENEKHELR
jgi:hypothetical protein